MSEPGAQQAVKRSSWVLLAVVAGMFAFGFALGPLYSAMCRITGYNGKTSGVAAVETAAPLVDRSRLVTVQFVTTVNGGRNWEFRPEQAQVKVHPGEYTTVNFFARNTRDEAAVAQATPNIAPWNATKYLHKSECFCFTRQNFAAGEGKDMPVRFVLDPELPADVDTVTLSYTFFDVTQSAQNAGTPNS